WRRVSGAEIASPAPGPRLGQRGDALAEESPGGLVFWPDDQMDIDVIGAMGVEHRHSPRSGVQYPDPVKVFERAKESVRREARPRTKAGATRQRWTARRLDDRPAASQDDSGLEMGAMAEVEGSAYAVRGVFVWLDPN